MNDLFIANELRIDASGYAMIAPFGDATNYAHDLKDGKQIKVIQRFDRSLAEALVQAFNSPLSKIKRKFMAGVDIFNGHPDIPGQEDRYPDAKPKGVIADLEVRENGLYGLPIFNDDGSDLVEQKRLRAFSARWAVDQVGVANDGTPIMAPNRLVSVGLTNNPNLPVELLNHRAQAHNTKDTDMDKKKLIEGLTKCGLTLANEATDDDILKAITDVVTEGAKAKADLTTANAKVAAADTAKAEAETTLANEKQAITTLTQERDKAVSDLANTKTALEASQKAHRTLLLDTALADGRVKPCDRPSWDAKLTADLANASTELAALKPALKTTPAFHPGRKATMTTANEKRQIILDEVDAKMKADKLSYEAAYRRVQAEKPALFETAA